MLFPKGGARDGVSGGKETKGKTGVLETPPNGPTPKAPQPSRQSAQRRGQSGKGSIWMWGTRELLREVDLGWFWRNPNECAFLDKEMWRRTAGYRVDRRADGHRETRMATMRTMGN